MTTPATIEQAAQQIWDGTAHGPDCIMGASDWDKACCTPSELTCSCDRELRAISTALRSRSDLREWRTIDSAPRDGSNILIIAAGAYSPEARQGWWDDGWRFYSRPEKFVVPGENYILEASHWMPLPATPITAAGDRG